MFLPCLHNSAGLPILHVCGVVFFFFVFFFQVDPTVIGGMVIEIGDKHIDMSMATKIKNITNALRESV